MPYDALRRSVGRACLVLCLWIGISMIAAPTQVCAAEDADSARAVNEDEAAQPTPRANEPAEERPHIGSRTRRPVMPLAERNDSPGRAFPSSLEERQFQFLMARKTSKRSAADVETDKFNELLARQFDLPPEAYAEEALQAGAKQYVQKQWLQLWEKRAEAAKSDAWLKMCDNWRRLSWAENQLLRNVRASGLDIQALRPEAPDWAATAERLKTVPTWDDVGYVTLLAALLHPGSADHADEVIAYAETLTQKFGSSPRLARDRSVPSWDVWSWLSWTPDQRVTQALISTLQTTEDDSVAMPLLSAFLDYADIITPQLDLAQLIRTARPAVAAQAISQRQSRLSFAFFEPKKLIGDPTVDQSVRDALLLTLSEWQQVELIFSKRLQTPEADRQRLLLLRSYVKKGDIPSRLDPLKWVTSDASSVELRVAAVEALVINAKQSKLHSRREDRLRGAIDNLKEIQAAADVPVEVQQAIERGLVALADEREEVLEEKRKLLEDANAFLKEFALQRNADSATRSYMDHMNEVTAWGYRTTALELTLELLAEDIRIYVQEHEGAWPQQLADLADADLPALPEGKIVLLPLKDTSQFTERRLIVAVGDEPLVLQRPEGEEHYFAALLADYGVAIVPVEKLDAIVAADNAERTRLGLPLITPEMVGGLAKYMVGEQAKAPPVEGRP